MKIKRNLRETHKNAIKKLQDDLTESNKLWHGSIGLVITLSASGLILTTAMAKEIFTASEQTMFLIMAWVLLFASIVSGLVANLESSIFFANIARDSEKLLDEIRIKLSKGIEEDEVDIANKSIIPGNIFWGALSINCFIISILLLCSQFLRNVFSRNICITIFITGLIVLLFINIYLLRKRRITR